MTDSISLENIVPGKIDPLNDVFVEEFLSSTPNRIVNPSTDIYGIVLKILFLVATLGLLYVRKPGFYIKAAIFVAMSLGLYFFG